MKLISLLFILSLYSCSNNETEFSLITEDVIKNRQGISIGIDLLPKAKEKK